MKRDGGYGVDRAAKSFEPFAVLARMVGRPRLPGSCPVMAGVSQYTANAIALTH